MTREDAKDNILEYYNVFRDLDWQIQDMFREGVDSRIDEIYDFFENKSCQNCKHYDGSHKCNNDNSIAWEASNRVYQDDYCKDFEQQKDSK